MEIVHKKYNTYTDIEKQQHTIEFLVSILSAITEYRDVKSDNPVAFYHVKRIQKYTNVLLKKLRDKYPEYGIIEDSDITAITLASSLHDIGKIAIPDNILMKPTKLSREEFDIMKRHTIYGTDILDRFVTFEDEFYRYCYDICKYHHERWDGKGYPVGLVGEKIPIWAQIVGLADVYDALVNAKVYRGAFEREKAEEMIISGACGSFNPKVIACFKECLEEFNNINEQYT